MAGHRRRLEPAHAPQHALDLTPLGFALFSGVEVLVAAPAATAEIRAGWRHAAGRRLRHRREARFQVAFVNADDLHLHSFTRRHVGHEHRPAVFRRAADAATAVGEFVDGKLHAKTRRRKSKRVRRCGAHPSSDGRKERAFLIGARNCSGFQSPVRAGIRRSRCESRARRCAGSANICPCWSGRELSPVHRSPRRSAQTTGRARETTP